MSIVTKYEPKWSGVEFTFARCGLNPGDEIRYDIPENFEKPGNYQWEALNDESAGELITSSVNQYVIPENFREKERQEEEITARWQKFVEEKREEED